MSIIHNSRGLRLLCEFRGGCEVHWVVCLLDLSLLRLRGRRDCAVMGNCRNGRWKEAVFWPGHQWAHKGSTEMNWTLLAQLTLLSTARDNESTVPAFLKRKYEVCESFGFSSSKVDRNHMPNMKQRSTSEREQPCAMPHHIIRKNSRRTKYLTTQDLSEGMVNDDTLDTN